MNQKNLASVFQKYREKFDSFNKSKDGGETFKWIIAKKFPSCMQEAISSSDEDFPAALAKVKKLTAGLIDAKQQAPFQGLCEFAKQSPGEVRQMFIDLYADDGGSRLKRTDQILAFLRKSDELLARYYPTSHLYANDLRSVSAYKFLYDPDNNYLYKYKEAKAFADHMEFEGELSGSEAVRLDAYYRMCDELVEAIRKDEKLLSVASQRYEGKYGIKPEDLHPDTNKHILAFDIIWCCVKRGLLDGIDYTPIPQPERNAYQERLKKARAAYAALQESDRKQILLTEALLYLRKAFGVGSVVVNKKQETGTVTQYTDTGMTVSFSNAGPKNLDPVYSFCNGILTAGLPGFDAAVEKYKGALQNRIDIEISYKNRLDNFRPYEDLLERLIDD